MLSIFPAAAVHEQNGTWQQKELHIQSRERILAEGETQKSRAVSEMRCVDVSSFSNHQG